MKHILVTYSAECAAKGHIDPNFTQLVYGNSDKNGNVLINNLEPGSYIFFNARIGNQRYITAYFYVEKILIKGKDDVEIAGLTCDAKSDEVIVIGSRTFSKILTTPLVFDKALMMQLPSYHATDSYFKSKNTELIAIRDKTLNPTRLTEEEKKLLLELCSNRG